MAENQFALKGQDFTLHLLMLHRPSPVVLSPVVRMLTRKQKALFSSSVFLNTCRSKLVMEQVLFLRLRQVATAAKDERELHDP